MKVSKIPGLGRFGVFIDDIDFKNMSDEEWMEIGKIHLESLVTIIRDVDLTVEEYQQRMAKWGTARTIEEYRLTKEYQTFLTKLIPGALADHPGLKEDDKEYLKTLSNCLVADDAGRITDLLKVTGKRTEDGKPLGMFAEGELLWHSNESGNLAFTPAVSLLGREGMVGSSTGFMTTTDWYEKQSESFRSELDEMILVHKFTPGKINPGLRREQDEVMYRNMCPVDGAEIPLIINSPGGYKGLHYSVNTISHVKGMSKEESDKLLSKISNELFVEEYMYDHWYTRDNDLCLFDNSIVQHRRLGGIANRLALRRQYDYSNLVDTPYNPYRQEPFRSQYVEQVTDIVNTLKLKDFKLPNLAPVV